MPTRNINLTEHDDQFIEEQVEAGKYQNASEVLKAGLRLLEQQTQTDEEKVALLRRLAAEGFDSFDQGQGVRFSNENTLKNAISRIGRHAAKSVRLKPAE